MYEVTNRKRKRQILAYLMVLCIAVSCVLVQSVDSQVVAAEAPSVVFNVRNDSLDAGQIQYKIGESGTWTPVTLLQEPVINDQGNSTYYLSGSIAESVSGGAIMYMKAIPGNGYELDTTRGVSVWVDGNSTSLGDEANTAIISDRGYAFTLSENKEYEFELGFQEQNGNQGGNQGNGESVDDDTIYIVLDNINGSGIYSQEAAGGKVELSTDGISYFEIHTFSSPTGTTSDNNGKLMYSFETATLYMKLTPNENNNANVNGLNHGMEPDGSYRLNAGESCHVEFGNFGGNPGDNPGEGQAIDKIIDLQLTTVVDDVITSSVTLDRISGDNYCFRVPDEFDFHNFEIEVLAITEVDRATQDIISDTSYAENSPNNFRSGLMFDSENRDAFEIMTHTCQDNILKCGILFHNESEGNEDGFPGFYITEIILTKDSYRGVSVDSQSQPDMYDFASVRFIDLSLTSQENPGEITCYYGDETIKLLSETEHTINSMEAYDLPSSAVTIDMAQQSVTIHSNFFDTVPLKITLSDQTIGYVVIKRIGIEIADYQNHEGNPPHENAYHGASGAGPTFPSEYIGKDNLVATFYHAAQDSDTAYEMVAILHFPDGRTEISVVESYGGTLCGADPNLRGSDYILWSGVFDENAPISASVTAIPTGSLSNEIFGGCAFGSGAGVEWDRN